MAKAAKKKKTKAKARVRVRTRKAKAAKSKPAGRAAAPSRCSPNLKPRLLEISDLSSADAVLGWDQATYMPKGGAAARGRQSALLTRLAHERQTSIRRSASCSMASRPTPKACRPTMTTRA